MNSLPDPSYFLHLSESFIKTARLHTDGDKPRLSALKEISASELATQPNPLLQIARDKSQTPVPVLATLSLGETLYQTHSFDQIGFSTLTEFIANESPKSLDQYELAVFQLVDGKPAPTASPTPLDLVFCGFNSKVIPELSDAFPNLDAEAKSITLSALDQVRFLKSQCADDEKVLLVEICNDRMHLILTGAQGLEGIRTADIGRQSLYATMAEVLHLHYIGSAIKLFTRSGFDSSELAPKLGKLFGSAISGILEAEAWTPHKVHISGLLRSQDWFRTSILDALHLESFQIDCSLLPFDVDDSVGELGAADMEIVAKIYSSLAPDGDFSWYSEFVGSLKKSGKIARRDSTGSNPPFPTAHPERVPEISVSVSESPPEFQEELPPEHKAYVPLDPPKATSPRADQRPSSPVHLKTSAGSEYTANAGVAPNASLSGTDEKRAVQAIPDHLLSDIEEYEGGFEDDDDYGGGKGRVAFKMFLLVLCLIIIGVMVTVVFFPKASDKYLGIKPPHVDFEDSGPDAAKGLDARNSGNLPSVPELSETDVASGVRNLRNDRDTFAYGGLFLPTNPSGATVIIGDLSPRQSPIKLPNIEPGVYEVTISKTGYETVTMSITIKPKEVLKIDAVDLKPTS